MNAVKNSLRRPLYRILTIDGGGTRGIIPGKVLCAIEAETGLRIAQCFDMIAGTSTGGILGLGLALPSLESPHEPRYTAEKMLDFYLKKKFRSKIFKRPPARAKPIEYIRAKKTVLRATDPLFTPPTITLGFDKGRFAARMGDKDVVQVTGNKAGYDVGVGPLTISVPSNVKDFNSYQFHSNVEEIRSYVQPKFASDGIENLLKERFGQTKLSELLPKEVFVATFNTTTMRHFIFSKEFAKNGKCPDVMAWEAARATSAAPTYFPAFTIRGNEHIDGGICMNDPTLAAIVHAQRMKIPKEDLFCVSLGTGRFTKPLAPTTHFGTIHWAVNIFDAASWGISSQTEEYVKDLLKNDRYFRIQIDLPENIALDGNEEKIIKDLKEWGEETIETHKDELELICQILRS